MEMLALRAAAADSWFIRLLWISPSCLFWFDPLSVSPLLLLKSLFLFLLKPAKPDPSLCSNRIAIRQVIDVIYVLLNIDLATASSCVLGFWDFLKNLKVLATYNPSLSSRLSTTPRPQFI